VYEITEPWEAVVGGSSYAAPKGEKPTDWKATIDLWPKSLSSDPRMAGLVGLTLEGPARHMLPLLRHLVEVVELLDAEYAEGSESDGT
jgi:hypothetical protein